MSGGPADLGEVLTDRALISHHQLAQARRAARRSGAPLVTTLLDRGLVEESAFVSALLERLDLPLFEPGRRTVEPAALREVSEDDALRMRLLPVSLLARGGQRVLRVAMADPLDAEAIEELEFATGCRIEPLIARPSQLVEAIRAQYRNLSAQPAARRAGPRRAFAGDMPAEAIVTRELRPAQHRASTAQRTDALIALLIRKGLITQQEYEEQLQALVGPAERELRRRPC